MGRKYKFSPEMKLEMVREYLEGRGRTSTLASEAARRTTQSQGCSWPSVRGSSTRRGHSIGNGGGALERLAKVDVKGVDGRLKGVNLEVTCDVRNTLTGKKGASHVFGPQKGADPGMVLYLDENVRHFAHVVKKNLVATVQNIMKMVRF